MCILIKSTYILLFFKWIRFVEKPQQCDTMIVISSLSLIPFKRMFTCVCMFFLKNKINKPSHCNIDTLFYIYIFKLRDSRVLELGCLLRCLGLCYDINLFGIFLRLKRNAVCYIPFGICPG